MVKSRVQVCPYSQKHLICIYPNKCTLNNRQLKKSMQHWMFYPRLKSIVWDRALQNKGFRKTKLMHGVWMCLPSQGKRAYRIIEWFYNFFRIDGAIRKVMTPGLCKDLKFFETEYNRLLWEGE